MDQCETSTAGASAPAVMASQSCAAGRSASAHLPPLCFSAAPLPPTRLYKHDMGARFRPRTPPMATRRVAPAVVVSPRGVCRTPSPAQRLRLGADASRSPAVAFQHPMMSSGSPHRSTSPGQAVLVSPVQVPRMALWHGPPRRPVGRTFALAPAALAGSPARLPDIPPLVTSPPWQGRDSQPTARMRRQPVTPEHHVAFAQAQEAFLSPEMSDLDASYRDVSSNDTTAVSPQTPSEVHRSLCLGPQGPPPPRPVRCSAERSWPSSTGQVRKEELLRELAEKEAELSSLRSVAAATSEQLEAARLRLTCVVCADADVHCIFQPCHHVVCCQECAGRCQVCPICRQPVQTTAAIYLP
mmetsp:Transcript_42285/g.94676  ORF Transcript_42285/g.94676 Transcript_42285/m.94676 type:complete len:355 (-) Transcript_42285:111-1175(-)